MTLTPERTRWPAHAPDHEGLLRALRASLLPRSIPPVPGLDIAYRYLAADRASEIGGDFYDVFKVGPNAWAVVVGDVSGTGPDAAAMTGLVRHALRASAVRTTDPAEMLCTANSLLVSEQAPGDEERFCTVSCAVLRPGCPTPVTVANAGHPDPLVLRADGRIEEAVSRGNFLGLLPTIDVTPGTVTLEFGDRLVLYTDGIIEARDGDGRFFGDAAFVRAAARCAKRSAEGVAGFLLEALEQFTVGDITDDLALLVVGATQ